MSTTTTPSGTTKEPVGTFPPPGEEETDPLLQPDEVIEPDDDEEPEPNVVTGNQLTLNVGGPKPVQSRLKVNAKQMEFGTTRQWKVGDVIHFNGTIEVRGAGVELMGKKGIPTRIQKAIIATLNLED